MPEPQQLTPEAAQKAHERTVAYIELQLEQAESKVLEAETEVGILQSLLSSVRTITQDEFNRQRTPPGR